MQASISNRTFSGFLLHICLLLLTIGCFTSCTKDENVERGYLRLNTNKISSIGSLGAVVSAEIISGNPSTITEYGFVWSTDEYPYEEQDDKQFKTGALSGRTFSDTIRPALRPNETYYVRAYVKTDHYIVHGNILSFKNP